MCVPQTFNDHASAKYEERGLSRGRGAVGAVVTSRVVVVGGLGVRVMGAVGLAARFHIARFLRERSSTNFKSSRIASAFAIVCDRAFCSFCHSRVIANRACVPSSGMVK